MSSATMTVEQNGFIGLDNHLPVRDKILLELGTPTTNGVKLREQLNSGDDFAPKVRKPYTITKQRERWTDEEHKKFIEALKLYGRAWRKIEEHVGTKTTVQIRSHAQKFFSKVVRESSIVDASSVRPIEIPPPRPKRKPMHPYPRKMVSPVNTGITMPEKSMGSASLKPMGTDNQSPTSILSAIGSDSSVEPESSAPDGSPTSGSSALALNVGSGSGLELPKCLSEGIISSSLEHEDENSSPDDQILMELELVSQNNASDKEFPNESAAQSLKLFGKTFLVMDPRGAPSSTVGICNPEAFDTNDETCSFHCKAMPVKVSTTAADDVQDAIFETSHTPVYSDDVNSNLLYAQMTSDESYTPSAHCTVPWLTLCSGTTHSNSEVHSPKPIKARLSCEMKARQDIDEQKEGPSNDSNTGTVRVSKGKSMDSEISALPFDRKGKEEISFSSYKLSKRISAHSLNRRKGFVPYKRCLSKQESTISSTKTTEERETQRIRLCM